MKQHKQLDNITFPLMQDIIVLAERYRTYVSTEHNKVRIPRSSLLLKATDKEILKALQELHVLSASWMGNEITNHKISFIHFIELPCLSADHISFLISTHIWTNLKDVSFNLNKYIDVYIE